MYMYSSSMFLLGIVPFVVLSENICDGSYGLLWKGDPKKCNIFYLCIDKKSFLYTCPEDTVFNEEQRTCVKMFSTLDKCSIKTVTHTEALCKQSEDYFITINGSCSKYIDCTTNTIKECYYPFLFDESSKRCKPYDIANCGARNIPIDPCDYEDNNCKSIQGCIPCSVRYPSCKGLENGLNPWPQREGSPYYVVCKDERVAYHSQCDFENKKEIFNPQKRTCSKV